MVVTLRLWQSLVPILRPILDGRPRLFSLLIFIGPRLYPARLDPGTLSAFPGRQRAHVADERWFYRCQEDWIAIVERLKQTPCPHCKTVGTLIRHGTLSGFDDSSPQGKTIRARRIFCSNRHQRRGCGRTFSVWLANKIRRLSLSTRTLWRFLQLAVVGSIAAAIRATIQATNCHRSDRTFQRIWKRFDRGQSRIRTALLGRGPPPELPAGPTRRPAAAQVLAHLQATFPHADCPIAAFQHATRSFFI
jgi:hypothetical protein